MKSGMQNSSESDFFSSKLLFFFKKVWGPSDHWSTICENVPLSVFLFEESAEGFRLGQINFEKSNFFGETRDPQK